MDALTALLTRNAASKLVEPAPAGDDLQKIITAALRAPDHARLRPWRFLTIGGNARYRLGSLYAQAYKRANPEATEEQLAKVQNKVLRAPLIVVVIVSLSEHPKVPKIEQQLSAASAAQNILLASHALGYAGIWRTGSMAYNSDVKQGLGLKENEEIVGFIYLGTRDGNAKPIPELDWQTFCQSWGDEP